MRTFDELPDYTGQPIFKIPTDGDHRKRNWRGGREEPWDPERIILYAYAVPQTRGPRHGYGSSRGDEVN